MGGYSYYGGYKLSHHFTLHALTETDIANIYAWYRASDARAIDSLLAIAQTCCDTHVTKADIGAFMLAVLEHDAQEGEYC